MTIYFEFPVKNVLLDQSHVGYFTCNMPLLNIYICDAHIF